MHAHRQPTTHENAFHTGTPVGNRRHQPERPRSGRETRSPSSGNGSILRQERARKREDLLQVTEAAPEAIAASVRSGWLTGCEGIDRRVGEDVNRRKAARQFETDVTDDEISWRRRWARLDDVCMIHTSPDAACSSAMDFRRGQGLDAGQSSRGTTSSAKICIWSRSSPTSFAAK